MGAGPSKYDPYSSYYPQSNVSYYYPPTTKSKRRSNSAYAYSQPPYYPPNPYQGFPQYQPTYNPPYPYSAYPYYSYPQASHNTNGIHAPAAEHMPGMGNPLPQPVMSVFEKDPFRHLVRSHTFPGSTAQPHSTGAHVLDPSAHGHGSVPVTPGVIPEGMGMPTTHEDHAAALAHANMLHNAQTNAQIIANASMTQPSWFLGSQGHHEPAPVMPVHKESHMTKARNLFRSLSASAAARLPTIPGKPFPPGHPALATLNAPPEVGAPRHPLKFDPVTSSLSHLSQHKVLYKKKLYPSVAHLFEALKFMKVRPDLADQIRGYAGAPNTLASVAHKWEAHKRRDWNHVMLRKMDEVQYAKFSQHPDLRAELVGTGNAELMNGDEADNFWGVGADGHGQNQLGKSLMRVRERLKREGAGR